MEYVGSFQHFLLAKQIQTPKMCKFNLCLRYLYNAIAIRDFYLKVILHVHKRYDLLARGIFRISSKGDIFVMYWHLENGKDWMQSYYLVNGVVAREQSHHEEKCNRMGA